MATSDPSSPSTPTEGLNVWQKIERRLEGILKDPKRPIPLQTYHKVYDRVYKFCAGLPPAAADSNGSGTNRPLGASVQGGEIYFSLKKFLCNHLEKTREQAEGLTGDRLLDFYTAEWDRFTTAAHYIQHLFQYLDRYWIPREYDDGKDNVYHIYTLHLVCWRSVVFDRLHEPVMNAVLSLIERHRDGNAINYQPIKMAVTSFLALDNESLRPNRQSQSSFTVCFEKPYIEDCKRYFLRDSTNFLASNSVVEYMKRAELQLAQELERSHMYLLDTISRPLMSACEDSLVGAHSDRLWREFPILLNQHSTDDLHRMFMLLGRIPDGHEPLRNALESHVRDVALGEIRQISQPGKPVDPKVYVDTLIGLHSRYQRLVNEAFDGQADFVRSLDSACSEFTNENSVCHGDSKKSAEMLVRYTDTLMKRAPTHNLVVEAYERSLNMVITLYKFLRDKDVFQDLYQGGLAKRLVYGNSASLDVENLMIGKLKEECGGDYSRKLQSMVQDINTSKDLTSSYKDYLQGSEEAMLDIPGPAGDGKFTVLGPEFRRFASATNTFQTPECLLAPTDNFSKFYTTKHQGRQLTWQWQLSKGELHAKYLRGEPILQLSVYQMAILLQFNESDQVTWSKISSETGLPDDLLDPLLLVFVNTKLLTYQPSVDKGSGRYAINMAFEAKKKRINFNVTIKREQRKEEAETRSTIDKDRQSILQAAVMRIMKTAGSKSETFQQSALIAMTVEVLQDSKSKASFVPETKQVESAIEFLINKDYIERLSNGEIAYVT